jgi:hypothetical protein
LNRERDAKNQLQRSSEQGTEILAKGSKSREISKDDLWTGFRIGRISLILLIYDSRKKHESKKEEYIKGYGGTPSRPKVVQWQKVLCLCGFADLCLG